MTECFIAADEMIVELLHVIEKDELEQIQSLRGRLVDARDAPLTPGECLSDLLDYCMGVIHGRWDIRMLNLVTSPNTIEFAPGEYPSCPTARLLGDDGASLGKPPRHYPTTIIESGILVEDIEHYVTARAGSARSYLEGSSRLH